MSFINKKSIFKVIFFLLSSIIFAQDYTLSVFPSRFNVSFETIKMENEADLGFLGTGFEILSVNRKLSSLYVGIQSFSAITGDRPGLITLGMNAGLKLPISKKHNVFVDTGFFIGGGGGGGAADGGGLILRPHINVEKQIGIIGLKIGYSNINFPSGEIKGSQFNFGFTLNGLTYLKKLNAESSTEKSLFLGVSKFNFAIVNTYYFDISEASISDSIDDSNRKVGLIGAQLEYQFLEKLYSIAKINGALYGGVDGYMSILFGVGVQQSIVNNKLNLESRILFGPTGGGSVESGGGATMQFEVGTSYFFKNGYYIKGMLGKTQAPWGDLNTKHFEIALGKSFNRLKPNLKEGQTEFTVPKNLFFENHISFSTYNRTYFSPDALDKNGNKYLNSFNLLCFEGQKFIGKHFSLNAATVWAYQGDYGAYAEGLVGLAYHQPIINTWKANVKTLFGAAGGGGLDVGSGFIFQYSAGVEKKLSSNGSIFVNFGKFLPLEGNFNPYSLDVGFAFDLYQIFRKN